MNDERGDLTPQQLDELASAYLDGEATAEEAALVESDPRLQELVEELRAIRELMAAPVDMPSDEVRDQMIARALDHRAPVVSMETARRRLQAIPPQARVILAAAAVVAAIALVGVTIFERQGDQFADDDMASAPVVADAPAMEMPESAPAPVDEESMMAAEESVASPHFPASDDAEDVFPAEAPAEEMMDDEMAIDLVAAPMEDEGYADPEPVEGLADEPEDGEVAMADEPEEDVETSGEVPLVFNTQRDLEDHAMQFVDDLVAAQSSGSDREIGQIDSLACPLFTEEEVDLLVRFLAVVEGIELEVSIYTGADFAPRELLLVQTSPPPECELHGPVMAMAWSTSP